MQLQSNRYNRLILATLATLGTTVPVDFDPATDMKTLVRQDKRAQCAIAANMAIDNAVRQIGHQRNVEYKKPDVYQHLVDAIAGTAFDFAAIEQKGFNPDLIATLKCGNIAKTTVEVPLTLDEQKIVMRQLDLAYTAIALGTMTPKDEGVLNEVFGAACLNEVAPKIGQYFGQDTAQA